MLEITENQIKQIQEIGLQKIGFNLGEGYDCISFVREIYNQVGLKIDLKNHPKLSYEDLYEQKSIGHLCFLKHKIFGKKRMNHTGIILPEQKILHYSSHFHGKGKYKVYLSSYEEVFKKYNYVDP